MNSVIVKAPAKVNLFLQVLSKRRDSYHNIYTLFERISLADVIKITKIPKGIVVKSNVFITRNPKDNLVYKAAEAILKRGKVKSGVKIEIKKRIPIAAGLGGGSSDAASTLRGINTLFRPRLTYKTLINIGRSLGADIPFFMLDRSFAIGCGRGDVLKPVKSKTRLWHIVINPPFKVATKEVYEAFDALSSARPKCLTPRFDNVKMGKVEAMLYNDLEEALVSKKRVIGSIIRSLEQLLGKKAIVSGSGPSLFCLYGTRREAMRARDSVLRSMPASMRNGWQIFVAGTC